MRLADKIMARAAAPPGHPMDRDFKALAGSIKNAKCFIVDRTTGVLSFETIRYSPARALARTLESTSFPAKTCWFEWLGPSASMGPKADELPRPGSIVPHRCGVLVETCDEGRRVGTLSYAWSMPGHDLEACPMSITFDWRVKNEPVPDLRRAAFAFAGRSWIDEVKAFHDQSVYAGHSFEEMLAVERRFGHVPCAHLQAVWDHLATAAVARPCFSSDIVANSLRDLEGEPTFLLGVLILMCAKGFVSIGEPDDFGRLNQARRKRGKPDLLTFRTITASGANVIRLSDRGGALETMQAVHAA